MRRWPSKDSYLALRYELIISFDYNFLDTKKWAFYVGIPSFPRFDLNYSGVKASVK
jgi:hypothetical protein